MERMTTPFERKDVDTENVMIITQLNLFYVDVHADSSWQQKDVDANQYDGLDGNGHGDEAKGVNLKVSFKKVEATNDSELLAYQGEKVTFWFVKLKIFLVGYFLIPN